MGFEVIILGAIAGFFAIRQIVKADEQSGQELYFLKDGPVVESDSAIFIPEDSSLKRHYLQNLEAERLAITNPYPSEFNLKRHFQAEMNQLLCIREQSDAKPQMISEPVKVARKAVAAKAASAKEPKKGITPEKAKAKPKVTPKPKVVSKPKAEPKSKAESKPKPKAKPKPAKTKSESKSE